MTGILAMENAAKVIGSYVITFAAIGLFTWRMLARARRAVSRVPGEDLPWT